MLVADKALAQRIERTEALPVWDQCRAFAEMDGNPFGMAAERYGPALAVTCRSLPGLELMNRVFCAGPGDEAHLEQAVAFLRAAGVRPRLDVSPHHSGAPFLARLRAEGWRMVSFQVALFGAPTEVAARSPARPGAGVEVRRITTAAEAGTAAEVYGRGFAGSGAQLDQMVPMLAQSLLLVWNRPGWRAYLATADGKPAGAALLHVTEGTGCLIGASTLPEARGRGIQKALLGARVADAAAAGCDLLTSQTGNGTISQQNMEKLGMRIAYTKAAFQLFD